MKYVVKLELEEDNSNLSGAGRHLVSPDVFRALSELLEHPIHQVVEDGDSATLLKPDGTIKRYRYDEIRLSDISLYEVAADIALTKAVDEVPASVNAILLSF